MKKTSFSANRVALAVAMICASVPAFAQVEAKVTGRVHFDVRNLTTGIDANTSTTTVSAADNFEIRRARIGMVGTINKDIAFEVVGNAVGSSTNFIDTAWMNYGFAKEAQFRAGRFKQPFSLEELTSSNSIDFMERSYGNQIIPAKRNGMMLHGEPIKGVVYGVSIFQNDFAEISSANGGAGNNYAARLAVDAAQIMTGGEDMVLHAGVGQTQGRSQVAATGSALGVLKLRSENRGLADTLSVNITGTDKTTIDNTKSVDGLELALAKGPFKFQAENFNSKFDMTNSANTSTANIKLKASYFEVMYNITGEQWAKSYKGGAFSSITPNEVFMKDYGGVVGNGIGAWQVGIRKSSYNASDSSVSGTATIKSGGTSGTTLTPGTSKISADTTTYALNWVMNANARVMLNYADTKFGSLYTLGSTSATTDREKVVSLRTQINF